MHVHVRVRACMRGVRGDGIVGVDVGVVESKWLHNIIPQALIICPLPVNALPVPHPPSFYIGKFHSI